MARGIVHGMQFDQKSSSTARINFLTWNTDDVTSELMNADINELKLVAKTLFDHATFRLGGLGFGTSFLSWVASFSAIYRLILDRTNWRSNMLTSLLVPYIFFSLPPSLFDLLRGQFGMWVAFIAVVLRLFSLVISQRQLGWRCDLSSDRLLPPSRAHSSVGWVQEFFYAEPWYI
ncbi:hypothetical protein R6Q57_012940 [Mikania cordata]